MDITISNELTKFNSLYKAMDDVYHDIAVRLNLSDSAFNILYTICIFGNGCQQKDICNTTFISKQTIHSSIKKLEQAGILVMQAGKGRDMHIHLTPAGQKLAEEKIIPVIEMENRTFAGMQPEERHQLLKLLEKYVIRLRKGAEEL